jgi:hypothetical protein
MCLERARTEHDGEKLGENGKEERLANIMICDVYL